MAAALPWGGLPLLGEMGMMYGYGVFFGEKDGIAGLAEVAMKERRRDENQEDRRYGQNDSSPSHGGHYTQSGPPGQFHFASARSTLDNFAHLVY